MKENAKQSDFGSGSMRSNILRLAVPLTAAQIINLLYNIIDRMFIGHLPENSTLALTGLGLTFPVILLITAFTNLFGMGGSALFSIARGQKDLERAENLEGTAFAMLLLTSIVLMSVSYLVKKPLLYLFGASDQTFPYSNQYLSVYLIGTPMIMLSLGMNTFINAQGFGRKGMMTVAIGAVLNILLDPLFIFVLKMGVQGAAVATVISQTVSSVWVLTTITSRKMAVPLRLRAVRVHGRLLVEIVKLGFSGFVMSFTNSLVSIVCNATLQRYGGDIYVGVMTVLSSIRELVSKPVSGLTGAAEPVLGFNYGAGKYGRVKQGIRFMSVTAIVYTTAAWILLLLFPKLFISIFNTDPELVERAIPSLTMYFFGFFMMSLQMAGQATFVGLGRAKSAIFFSIFRKVVIVVPLTLLLPRFWELGVKGVFLAEPVSNWIGGAACFITMMLTVYTKLPADRQPETVPDSDT